LQSNFTTMLKRPTSEAPDSEMTSQPDDPRILMVELGDSETLKEIVKGSIENFFRDYWQQKCHIFRRDGTNEQSRPDEACWKDDENPFKALVSNGWPVLTDMLEQGRHRFDPCMENASNLVPLIFQNQECISKTDPKSSNLSMSYLDGCSIVLNHADTLNGFIARLCQDLQKSFPHAYANAYVTPPSSKAVPPHADDRDVLVIQVIGKKKWKVYGRVPIPFPYPNEQVGKEGMPIPPSVFAGPLLVDDVLRAGDVLYMPRGFIHEAKTQKDDLSFHITIALATHDWTLAGTMRDATANVLTQVVEYRMALPLNLGRGESADDRKQLQEEIDEAIERLRQEITAERVCQHLRIKYSKHNQGKHGARQAAIERARSLQISTTNSLVVGRQAAAKVTLSTKLRCSTQAERDSLPPLSTPQGLHVREETADALFAIVQLMKGESSLICSVKDLLGLLTPEFQTMLVCDLTLLSFAKCCVELGAFAILA